MKTRVVQISQADLVNSQATPLIIDISMNYTRLNYTTKYMLPKQIRIENYTGVDIYFTLVKEDELIEYNEGLPYYALVPVVNGNVLVNANAGMDSHLILQANPSALPSDIVADCVFYGLFYQ